MSAPELPSAKKPRGPRKLTKARLMNGALFHLQRFAASRESLRQVLQRRARRALAHHGSEDGDEAQAQTWIEEVLDSLTAQGFLNDRAYAEARARTLAGRGQAQRSIRQTLRNKGVAEEDRDSALARLAEETGSATDPDATPDEAAALAYVRRRRLGPWRPPESRADFRQKDLAALARRGFSLDVARRVLEAPPEEEEV